MNIAYTTRIVKVKKGQQTMTNVLQLNIAERTDSFSRRVYYDTYDTWTNKGPSFQSYRFGFSLLEINDWDIVKATKHFEYPHYYYKPIPKYHNYKAANDEGKTLKFKIHTAYDWRGDGDEWDDFYDTLWPCNYNDPFLPIELATEDQLKEFAQWEKERSLTEYEQEELRLLKEQREQRILDGEEPEDEDDEGDDGDYYETDWQRWIYEG